MLEQCTVSKAAASAFSRKGHCYCCYQLPHAAYAVYRVDFNFAREDPAEVSACASRQQHSFCCFQHVPLFKERACRRIGEAQLATVCRVGRGGIGPVRTACPSYA